MAWFKRHEKGITTPTEDKMDVPKGLWYKSPTGKIIDAEDVITARQQFLTQVRAQKARAASHKNTFSRTHIGLLK